MNDVWRKDDFFTRKDMDVFILELCNRPAQYEMVQIMNVHGREFVLKVRGHE